MPNHFVSVEFCNLLRECWRRAETCLGHDRDSVSSTELFPRSDLMVHQERWHQATERSVSLNTILKYGGKKLVALAVKGLAYQHR